MRVGYLDTFAGISGDMLLGGLLAAGLELDALVAELSKLPVAGWELSAQPVSKCGITATQATVSLTDEKAHSGHHGRSCAELVSWVEGSSLPADVIKKATSILWSLGRAEGRVHGKPPEEIHFHELGGIDTIIDVVGAVVGLRLLGVERVYCSPLPVSHGQIECAHGILPVPPPAVTELLHGVPTRPLDLEGETVTPTGAALAVGLAEGFGLMPAMTLEAVGYGAGQREWPSLPNVLRLCIGQREPGAMPGAEGGERIWDNIIAEQVMMIETNLDDINPELIPDVLERCQAAGAIDTWLTPIQMKKGRPAIKLTALVPPDCIEAVSMVIIEHSTTLGVRSSVWERRCLPREFTEVETRFGKVTVKVGKLGGRVITVAPEFEDCRRLAEENDVTLKSVYAAALAGAQMLVG